MKRFFELVAMTLILSLACISGLEAQAGNVGAPLVTHDIEPVCDDGTPAWALVQTVVGESTATVVGYFDAEGNAYTLSGNGVEAGPCTGSSGATTTIYNATVEKLCDDGTPFYRIAIFTDGNATPTTVTDLDIDLATAYIVSGTISDGPCYTTTVANAVRYNIDTDGVIIPAGYFSWSFTNVGVTPVNITVGILAIPLLPGETTWFNSFEDPATKQWFSAPSATIDAAGGTVRAFVHN